MTKATIKFGQNNSWTQTYPVSNGGYSLTVTADGQSFSGKNFGAHYTNPTPIPNQPTLNSPVDGIIDQSLSPTLSWNASSGATSYTLQVSQELNFSTSVFNQSGLSGTSVQVSGLTYNSTYYWRVSATNSSGTSAFSAIRNFSTLATPIQPTLLIPENGVTSISINPLLSWNTVTNVTTVNRHMGFLVGSSFDYKLSKRFALSFNYKISGNTMPGTPLLSNFLIGSRMSL